MGLAEDATTQYVTADNGVKFAYRRFGKANTVPLVFHIHFRGTMDFWDPLILNTLATEREVVIFDNAGVGKSTGEVPVSFIGWAADMAAFIKSITHQKVDILGFSMGGLAVTMVALNHPEIIRKLIIAGAKPSIPSADFVPGIVWPQEKPDMKYTMKLAGAASEEEGREGLKYGLFPDTPAAGKAFDEYWARLKGRKAEPVNLNFLDMEHGGNNQIAAVMDTDVPNPKNSFDRLGELKMPVLVANGDDDTIIPSSRSWELLHEIVNAQLIIYPRSGHGFLWQYPTRFAEDVNRFLDGADFENN